MVLRWFIDEEVVNAALSGNIIEEVEDKPEKVPASCLDDKVCLESCQNTSHKMRGIIFKQF